MRDRPLSPASAEIPQLKSRYDFRSCAQGVIDEDIGKCIGRGLFHGRLRQQQQPPTACEKHYRRGAAEWNDGRVPRWNPTSLQLRRNHWGMDAPREPESLLTAKLRAHPRSSEISHSIIRPTRLPCALSFSYDAFVALGHYRCGVDYELGPCGR